MAKKDFDDTPQSKRTRQPRQSAARRTAGSRKMDRRLTVYLPNGYACNFSLLTPGSKMVVSRSQTP